MPRVNLFRMPWAAPGNGNKRWRFGNQTICSQLRSSMGSHLIKTWAQGTRGSLPKEREMNNNFNVLDDKLWALCYFAGAAVTKYHRPGGLNRNVFSHSPGSCKSKIEVSAGSVPLEASSLGLQMAVFSRCSCTIFPLDMCIPVAFPHYSALVIFCETNMALWLI